MSEDFLHFIWKHRLFHEDKLIFPSGDSVAVIDPGQHNTNAGPDFINARLRFDCVTWAGNVEIHKNASDWKRHNHHNDLGYDNVILHLVQHNDMLINRSNGEVIPTLELVYDKALEQRYQQLLESSRWIPCQQEISTIDKFILMQWFTSLAVERIQRKTNYFISLLESNNNHWEDSFYQALAKGFGMNINALPFEILAKSTPLSLLAKHRDNLLQLEALLFGQAGMLEEQDGDSYYQSLKKEYQYLQHKYQLNPIGKHLWKFLRLRPFNFPNLRIAQLAMMIHNTEFLFSGLIQNISIETIQRVICTHASEYWDTHYTFNKPQIKPVKKGIAQTAMNAIIINTIVPFLFVFGIKKDQVEYKDKAIQLLESIDDEENTITSTFKTCGINATNALESQALLELKNEYCTKKKCLECRIGCRLIIK